MLRYFRDFKRLSFRQIVLVWVLALAVLVWLGTHIKALRPDHILFILLLTFVVSMALGRRRSRQFLKDFTPFYLFWLAYDMLRGVADQVRHINIENVYRIEHLLFGWMLPSYPESVWQKVIPAGNPDYAAIVQNPTPPLWFQAFKHVHDGSALVWFLDLMTGLFYGIHFFVPWILGIAIWGYLKDRRLFHRFIYAFAILNTMGLITFVVFPAAPPWYVTQYGFVQPGVETLVQGNAAGLVKIDRILGTEIFSEIWQNMNPNRFAAVPSLHGGHSLIVAIFGFLAFRGRKWRWAWWLYPAGMWFSAIYLNHHYIFDPALAAVYLGIAILLTEKIVYPLWIRKYLLDWSELSPEEQAKLPPPPNGPEKEEIAPPTPEGS